MLPSLSTQSISPPGKGFLIQDNIRIQVDQIVHFMLVTHVDHMLISFRLSTPKYKNASPSEVRVLLNLHRKKSIRHAFEKSFHIVFKDLKPHN